MRKPSTVVAWVMLAIYAAGIVFTAALAIPNGSVARDPTGVLYQLDFTAFMVVGALIVARRPSNAIGWLFSGVGLLAMPQVVTGQEAPQGRHGRIQRDVLCPGARQLNTGTRASSKPGRPFNLATLFAKP